MVAGQDSVRGHLAQRRDSDAGLRFGFGGGPPDGPASALGAIDNPGTQGSDVVVVETEDAFGGVITSEQDSPTAKLKFPFLNPQSGPIAVRGASKGDCLAVHIQAVETRGAQPGGLLRSAILR